MNVNELKTKYAVDAASSTIAREIGKGYRSFRENSGAVRHSSAQPNGGYLREFPRKYSISFTSKNPKEKWDVKTIKISKPMVEKDAIKEAIAKLKASGEDQKYDIRKPRTSTWA